MEVKNQKLDLDQFLKERKQVLSSWPTGKKVDLKRVVEYQRQIPSSKRFGKKLLQAKNQGDILVQPRAGVPLVEEQIKLLNYLEKVGKADLLPVTVDSYTRQGRFRDAKKGLEESRKKKKSLLNGFPIVNHGVEATRKVTEAVGVPIQVRHGTPDARLLAEISFGAGFTAFEGGAITYNIPYAKDVPLKKSIRDWMYVDRLVGLYEKKGISLNRESFGPLTGTLVPPSLANAISIIEGLLAAEQGVKNISLGYGQSGNLVQDLAAMKSLRAMAQKYLAKVETEVNLTTVFHQWMGIFPQDSARAFSVIALGATVAALAQATKVVVKTPKEALGIPEKKANAQGLQATKQVISMLSGQTLTNSLQVEEEEKRIEQETEELLENVFELGKGDIARGTIRVFEKGFLDVPFAPSKYNLGKVLPVRDSQGAVRFLDFGNLPFSPQIKKFHQQKIKERVRKEKREISFEAVKEDIYSIAKAGLPAKDTDI